MDPLVGGGYKFVVFLIQFLPWGPQLVGTFHREFLEESWKPFYVSAGCWTNSFCIFLGEC